MDHAKLSPSGAHRWMNCPGSVRLEADFPDDSSSYAAEGTLAHDISAIVLEEGVTPESFIGKRYDVDGFVFTVTEDMVAYVRDYVSLVQEYAQGGTLLVERWLDLSDSIGVEETFGTSDAVIIKDEVLTVIDLKYGMGVAVSAENNPQLMLYALGALDAYSYVGDFEEICMVIHQPRLNVVSEFWVKVDEMEAFRETVKAAAQVALTADAELVPGEKQCKFCKAKSVCPALSTEVSTIVHNTNSVATVAEMNAFLGEQQSSVIASAMDRVELVEMWAKGVREEAYRRLKDGIEVPGYKLVEGRKGNRAWADEAAVEAAFKSYRFKIEQMYDLKLISPTKAEKLLSDNPRRWAKLEKLITRADGKPSVAPVTDKRPALAVSNVAGELANFAQQADD